MEGNYLLDKDNIPYQVEDIIEWAKKFERSSRHVGIFQILDDGGKHEIARVSTVFLGIDHSFGQRGSPLLFETLVTSKYDCPYMDEMERYATYAEAQAGHNRWAKIVQDWTDAAYPKPEPQLPALQLRNKRTVNLED